MKIIGITMRVEKLKRISDTWDALSHDWQEFMDYALPNIKWVPIPNLGKNVINYIKDFKIDGVILTGGNDIGSNAKRDATENSILLLVERNQLPVIGICRGFQMIQVHFGGIIEKCNSKIHVSNHHEVLMRDNLSLHFLTKINKMTVNSYHKFGVRVESLSKELKPFAITEDGWVEGIMAKNYPILAVLWHPERARPFKKIDKLIFEYFSSIYT